MRELLAHLRTSTRLRLESGRWLFSGITLVVFFRWITTPAKDDMWILDGVLLGCLGLTAGVIEGWDLLRAAKIGILVSVLGILLQVFSNLEQWGLVATKGVAFLQGRCR